jgi:hypothetical protein
MKTLNAKRIAAVVAGAALLGVGLAFAGPITFQNIPIINNNGQPVVQIVVGSSAKPSDGVVAANIAAAIGNLAFTSVPVTASVNQTQANKVLGVSVSSSSYTLSNQQVWLNESGIVSSSSTSYVFGALIGSVLNQAVILNSPQSTKTLQGAGTQYSFPETTTTSTSPAASPYTSAGSVPFITSVVASNNGGGVSFPSGFSVGGSPLNDNLLEITNSQLPTLASNFGGNGESTYLWLTGFPVFDQGTSGALVNKFMLMDAGGAYQATFSTPIQDSGNSNSTQINVPIKLLGQNYTIINESPAGSHAVGGHAGSFGTSVVSTSVVAGGHIFLASSLAPIQTIYVGHNISSGPWTVELTDLGQPNSNGLSPASLSVMYNGQLTNTSSVQPGTTTKFNVTGKTLYVNVNATFAGLYAYQKWAKMQLYTNVFEVQSGHQYNQTTNGNGWYDTLLWTNTSGSGGAKALQSIIIYNTSPGNLGVGQSFTFIENPQRYKLTFLGDTLGSANFDSVTVTSTNQGSTIYQNLGSIVTPGLSITNITEPVQLLTTTSQIPNAFTYAGQTSSSVQYDLTPYKLNEDANAVSTTAAGFLTANDAVNSVILSYAGDNALGAGNWITVSNPLTVLITGYATGASTSPTTQSIPFNAPTQTIPLTTKLYNVTGIQLNRALPGSLSINVTAGNSLVTVANSIVLASLVNLGTPGVLYNVNGQNYESMSVTATGNVIYNQQNGQTTNTFVLTTVPAGHQPAVGVGQYFQYTIGEVAVPTNTAAVDGITIGIDNSTSGPISSQQFQLNYSAAYGTAGSTTFYTGSRDNVTYTSSAGTVLNNVQAQFRTEKGSQVVSIGPGQDTFNLAKLTDMLQFSVTLGNSTTTGTSSKSYTLYGPYTVGQVTNIPNVSIAKVAANVVLGSTGTSYTVSGIGNLTATPSVATATQPVLLSSLPTTPLVVLDSAANPGSNLILIGSGYVNTLSQQIQKSYNVSMTPATQLVQTYGNNRILIAGYYANQTTAAGNSFIQQLYAQAT